MSNRTVATCGQGCTNRAGAHEITNSFDGVRVAKPQVFNIVSYVQLFFFSPPPFFSQSIISLFSFYEFKCQSGIFRPTFMYHDKKFESIR